MTTTYGTQRQRSTTYSVPELRILLHDVIRCTARDTLLKAQIYQTFHALGLTGDDLRDLMPRDARLALAEVDLSDGTIGARAIITPYMTQSGPSCADMVLATMAVMLMVLIAQAEQGGA